MQIIEELIHRARRRLVVNEALGQFAFAAAITAGGLALILLLGTRFLEWWTLALLSGIALSVGAMRVSRRIPSGYRIAQRLDAVAGLHDLLSTAVYFERGHFEQKGARGDGAMLGLQRRQAEEAAGSVDLQAAMPLKFPRAVYPLAALTLLASSLVVLRYALTNSLDLRAPITEALFQDQLARRDVKKPQPPADTKSFKALKAAEALMAKLNMPTSPDQQQDPDALDKAIDQALAPPSAKSDKSEKSANAGKTGEQQNANGTEPGQNGDPLNGQQANSANQDAKSQQSGQQGNQNEKAQSSNGAESSSSLISKLKDAVSNMLSRNRQDGANDRQSGNPSQQMSQGKPDRANGQKNAGGRGQENAQAQADAQEGDPNGDAQDGQQGQGKNAAKNLSQASAQAGSGIGSQNGEKDVRAAAQLKAMGKISEIIGKRAATISGETMIEVQSGNQTLRTAYNERSATHGEADSDVSRDEIPPALQTYVANYFEQIRRSETAAAPHRSGDGEPARKR